MYCLGLFDVLVRCWCVIVVDCLVFCEGSVKGVIGCLIWYGVLVVLVMRCIDGGL